MSGSDHPGRWDFKPYRLTVARILNQYRPATVLDIACGEGWIKKCMNTPVFVHGLDHYEPAPADYDQFSSFLMDEGVPDQCGVFDTAVCCEAIMYLQNFGVFFTSVNRHLKMGGRLILSVPNPTYGASRIDQVILGFPRANNYFVNSVMDSHMPWLPLNFYQIRFLLGLNGFSDVEVHEVDEPKPKHAWERLVGVIAKAYVRSRLRKDKTEEGRKMWRQALSDQVIYGRRLVLSAVKTAEK